MTEGSYEKMRDFYAQAGRIMRLHALDLPDCIRNIVLCINEFKSQ